MPVPQAGMDSWAPFQATAPVLVSKSWLDQPQPREAPEELSTSGTGAGKPGAWKLQE